MSLTESISLLEIKKIFSNKTHKKEYLNLLAKQTGKVFSRAKSVSQIDEAIIESWDYEISKNIIREMFVQTDKYDRNKSSGGRIDVLLREWDALKFGEFKWTFMPQNFDQFVHKLNRRDIPEQQKDKIISNEAIKFRRIKDLNAARNDYIEYLIVKNNDNVIPTFSNVRGVDFYINGEPFDQKVSKSVGEAFRNIYGGNYRQIAINHPEYVAKCLYEHQDEERFGSESRLFVVNLDENLSAKDIENSLQTVDFYRPLNIQFEYTHKHSPSKSYEAKCYVVLLQR